MKVTLLRLDGIETAMLAASVCVSEDMPSEGSWKGLVTAIDSGHDSLLEHIVVSFAIEGISRVAETQLVRHRIGCSYSIQSGRYCNRDPTAYTVPDGVSSDAMLGYDMALEALDEDLKAKGVPAEDRRYLYSQGTPTNIVLTMNYRALSHFMGLRLCTRAQREIRELAMAMKAVVIRELDEKYRDSNVAEALACRLVPKCAHDMMCRERRSCGFMPKATDLLAVYNEHRRSP